jgi:hypothetical protein
MRSSIVRPSWFAMHRARLLVALVVCFSYIAWLASLRPDSRTVLMVIPASVPAAATPEPVTVPVLVTVPVAIAIQSSPSATLDELPAISDDGSTIATKYVMGEDERVMVRFVSTTTSETLEEIPLHSPENTVRARTKLEAGRFRSLVSIPQVDIGSEYEPGLSMLYDRERDEHEVTILEDDTRELWTDRFVATERGYPARPNEEDVGPDCYPSKTQSVASSWDPRTRTLVVEVHYVGWACDCTTWAVHHYVRHI